MQIAEFSVDSTTAALSPVPGSPASPPGVPSTVIASPSPTVVHPTGKFFYASYEFSVPNVGVDGGVAAFSIDATSGELTAVPGSPFSVGGYPGSVAIDASGRFLIVGISARLGGRPGNCLAVLFIDPGTGGLTAVPGSPFGPLLVCEGIAADPSQGFVYTGTINPAVVFGFSVDQASG